MAPPPVTAASSPDPPAVEVANPGKSEQFWLESSHGDKAKFWAKRWYPTNPESGEEVKPKSTVIFCHGFVEYVDRYRNILQVFSAGGHEVVGFDQRGWGQTVLATGNAKRNYGNTTWPQQMEDLEFVIRETKKRTDEKWGAGQVPIFIMGHSMGGGIVLAFMTRPDEWRTKNRVQAPSQEAKDMVKGVISLSPWLRLTDQPHWLLVWVGNNILSKIPGMPWKVDLKGSGISRDPVVADNYENDRFCQKSVHLKAIQGPLLGGTQMIEKDHKLWPTSKPLLIVHGDADQVTHWSGSKDFHDRVAAEDKELKIMEGYYHDTLNEPGEDKLVTANHIVDWLNKKA